jgi:hypothetical protein
MDFDAFAVTDGSMLDIGQNETLSTLENRITQIVWAAHFVIIEKQADTIMNGQASEEYPFDFDLLYTYIAQMNSQMDTVPEPNQSVRRGYIRAYNEECVLVAFFINGDLTQQQAFTALLAEHKRLRQHIIYGHNNTGEPDVQITETLSTLQAKINLIKEATAVDDDFNKNVSEYSSGVMFLLNEIKAENLLNQTIESEIRSTIYIDGEELLFTPTQTNLTLFINMEANLKVLFRMEHARLKDLLEKDILEIVPAYVFDIDPVPAKIQTDINTLHYTLQTLRNLLNQNWEANTATVAVGYLNSLEEFMNILPESVNLYTKEQLAIKLYFPTISVINILTNSDFMQINLNYFQNISTLSTQITAANKAISNKIGDYLKYFDLSEFQ